MGRAKLIRQSEFYYHITMRTNHKDWFTLPLEEVWRICLESLKLANAKYKVEFAQFVLMNNHYHLLIKTPNCDIDKFMYVFNSALSLNLRMRSHQINRMFGGRYKWSIVTNQNYLFNVVRYVFQNPIRAGLVTRCEEYKFSSIQYLFPMASNDLLFKLPIDFDEKFLNYLNHNINDIENEKIKRGLMFSKFKGDK